MNSEMDSAAHISTPTSVTNTGPNQVNTINESHGNRNHNIDALRGLAILGILFMNIFFMNDSFYGYAPHLIQPKMDIFTEVVSNVFLEGRFLSLLSILFGAGLLVQFQRYESQSLPAYPLMKKRLLWLMLIGLMHGVFIWAGDILLTYGISAFLALNYINSDLEILKKRATQFVALSLILVALFSLTIEDDLYFRGSELHLEQLQEWSAGYLNTVILQLIQVGFMLIITPFTLIWFIGGLMMWGMALYRQGIFEHGLDRVTLLKCITWTIIFSVIDTLLGFSSNPVLKELSATTVIISAIPMAMIYIHLIVNLCKNSPHALSRLQDVGKLALSCYIIQSVIGVILFRYIIQYYAPELHLIMNRIDYVFIAGVIIGLQLVFAPLYLRFFKQGPLEALWRNRVRHSQNKMTSQ